MNAKLAMKNIVRRQYRDKLNHAAQTARIERPDGGWLRLVRQAMGMTGRQIGNRLGVTKVSISQREKAELDGSITLKTLQETAEAMGCRLVYAVVPADESVEAVISKQAEKRARAIVEKASIHMALEGQALTGEQLDKRVAELKHEFMETVPKEIWEE